MELGEEEQRVHFTDYGTGPMTVVFLHGNLSSSRWWEKVIPRLPPHWRCIAPDLRGFGKSPKPPTGYSIQEMSMDIEQLMNGLGLEKFAMVGHSLGGAVCLQHTLDHPGNLWGLVLVDPVPPSGLIFNDDVFELLASMRSGRTAMKQVLKSTAPSAEDDEYFERLVTDAFDAVPQAFLEIPKAMGQFNVTDRLSEISCPVLCIQGEYDQLIPREKLEAMGSRVEDFRFVLMKGVGHSPQIESPKEFTVYISEFLSAAYHQASTIA